MGVAETAAVRPRTLLKRKHFRRPRALPRRVPARPNERIHCVCSLLKAHPPQQLFRVTVRVEHSVWVDVLWVVVRFVRPRRRAAHASARRRRYAKSALWKLWKFCARHGVVVHVRGDQDSTAPQSTWARKQTAYIPYTLTQHFFKKYTKPFIPLRFMYQWVPCTRR